MQSTIYRVEIDPGDTWEWIKWGESLGLEVVHSPEYGLRNMFYDTNHSGRLYIGANSLAAEQYYTPWNLVVMHQFKAIVNGERPSRVPVHLCEQNVNDYGTRKGYCKVCDSDMELDSQFNWRRVR